MVWTKTWVGVVGSLAVVVGVTFSNATEMGPKNKIPDDVLFQDQAAFCEGCYALVHEVGKLLTLWQKEKGSLEDHIDAALLTACTTDTLRSYVLSPPKMARLCSGIRAHYMDQIGLGVLKHYSRSEAPNIDTLFRDICRTAIPACPKGVTPMSVAREESRRKAAAEKEAKTAVPEEAKKKKKKKKATPKQQDGTKERTSSEQKDEL